MLAATRRWAYLGVGWCSLGLGVLGIPLPLLPTTPFLLLAAICFARGSEPLHHWLMSHPTFGPMIKNYQTQRAISRRTKWVSSVSLLIALSLSIAFRADPLILGLQACALCFVAFFIWRHPEPANTAANGSPDFTADEDCDANAPK
ncbi:MAG: YbaN family protein [Pseudomonadota bacterium]